MKAMDRELVLTSRKQCNHLRFTKYLDVWYGFCVSSARSIRWTTGRNHKAFVNAADLADCDTTPSIISAAKLLDWVISLHQTVESVDEAHEGFE